MLLPRQQYQLWIEAIFDYFFPFPSRHKYVLLAFDDGAKATISERLECDEDEFERLIRQFARPRDSVDAFRFWRGDDDDGGASTPTYLGILAALALAASRIDIVMRLSHCVRADLYGIFRSKWFASGINPLISLVANPLIMSL